MDSGIYVRGQKADGSWAALDAVYEISDRQFCDWAQSKGMPIVGDDGPLGPDERLEIITELEARGAMIYRMVAPSSRERGI